MLVGSVLGGLFKAGVEVADIGRAVDDSLAVQLQHDPQDAMGRRVLGSHVDDHHVVPTAEPGRHVRFARRCGQDLIADVGQGRFVRIDGELHRLIAQGIVLAERVALPIVGQENAAQLWVALELHAEEVVGFPLVPIGSGPDGGHTVDRRRVTRQRRLEPQPVVVFQRVELVHRHKAG